MRTSLPVSTISYNSVGFLCSTLERMMDNGEIAFYAFIPHHGEGGDKDHVHLYVEPSKLRSQDDWKAEYFREFDPQVPDKPLSVTTWRKSNWKDWYLYGLHDRAYIALKGEKKQFEYTPADMYYSDADAFAERVAECDVPVGDKTFLAVRFCVECGYTWSEAVASGLIPSRSLTQAKEIFIALNDVAMTRERPAEWEAYHNETQETICDGLFG